MAEKEGHEQLRGLPSPSLARRMGRGLKGGLLDSVGEGGHGVEDTILVLFAADLDELESTPEVPEPSPG